MVRRLGITSTVFIEIQGDDGVREGWRGARNGVVGVCLRMCELRDVDCWVSVWCGGDYGGVMCAVLLCCSRVPRRCKTCLYEAVQHGDTCREAPSHFAVLVCSVPRRQSKRALYWLEECNVARHTPRICEDWVVARTQAGVY